MATQSSTVLINGALIPFLQASQCEWGLVTLDMSKIASWLEKMRLNHRPFQLIVKKTSTRYATETLTGTTRFCRASPNSSANDAAATGKTRPRRAAK